jgi:YesN/AraC family two-component response regulator
VLNFTESLLKELSIRSEYDEDYSEKSTTLKILLENAIVSGNIEIVRKAASIAEQIKDLKILFDEDLNIVKLHVASNVASFVEVSIKNGLPKDVAMTEKKKYFTRIAYCLSKKELAAIHFEIAEGLIEATKKYSMKNLSSVVKMAIEYIHNNKFRFLFAKDVSDAIRVNRSYLSKKFKEEVGQTITDYIHRVKMDLAIELMESNIQKYNEIAELLGYANYSYFSKVFKKFHCKTPNEYLMQQ